MKAIRIWKVPVGMNHPQARMWEALLELRIPIPPKDDPRENLDTASDSEEFAIPRETLVEALKAAQRFGAIDYWRDYPEPLIRFRKKLCIAVN